MVPEPVVAVDDLVAASARIGINLGVEQLVAHHLRIDRARPVDPLRHLVARRGVDRRQRADPAVGIVGVDRRLVVAMHLDLFYWKGWRSESLVEPFCLRLLKP